jgi:hypothetical protein
MACRKAVEWPAARLWNGIPQHLTVVEDSGAFKTWIFNQAFGMFGE